MKDGTIIPMNDLFKMRGHTHKSLTRLLIVQEKDLSYYTELVDGLQITVLSLKEDISIRKQLKTHCSFWPKITCLPSLFECKKIMLYGRPKYLSMLKQIQGVVEIEEYLFSMELLEGEENE